MLDDIYQETQGRMGKTIVALKNELKRVRTGRASLSLLDGIRVDYYGTLTPLDQMAHSFDMIYLSASRYLVTLPNLVISMVRSLMLLRRRLSTTMRRAKDSTDT